ncbi:MAG: hypothetical protein HC835_21395 [Oscillatoriales cyanobacterium RM2_1_1]|nr:hypothetical protein [Oscillatoriales cyanobacterium SM2_3_0]NJO47943.1 hypothetical protein [Oscillatoriales cyanobacterium RM2_1_1]
MDKHYWLSKVLITGALALVGLGTAIARPSQGIPTKPETIRSSTEVSFRGSVTESAQVGAEYILFQRDKTGQVQGLIYLQNSDVGACFQGNYEVADAGTAASERIQNLTYAYPIMGEPDTTNESGWEMDVAKEALNLNEFPYSLDRAQVNEGVQRWFQKCVELFEE